MGFGDFLKKKIGDAIGTREAPPPAPPPADEAEEEEASSDDDDGSAVAADDDERDDWGPWQGLEFVEYWYRVQAISLEQAKGEIHGEAAMRRFGIGDQGQLSRVQNTFNKHFGGDARFMQAMMDGSMRAQQEQMKQAIKPGQMDPIDGVSIETWGRVSARKAQMAGADAAALGKLYAEFGVDEATFHRADQGWQARMRQADDPMAAAAIATEYAKYFAAAGQGAYGATAQAASAGLGVGGQIGAAASAPEPCTFERYVEIMAAQAAWSEQGRDIQAMLKSTFGLTILDYSNISAYWSQKQQSDWQRYHREYTEYEAKFKQKYSAPSADDDLSV